MQLEHQAVVVYLTPEGFAQLNSLLDVKNELDGVTGVVRDTDGFALWLSPAGERWMRIIGVPWHHLRAIEMEWQVEPVPEVRKTIGFKS